MHRGCVDTIELEPLQFSLSTGAREGGERWPYGGDRLVRFRGGGSPFRLGGTVRTTATDIAVATTHEWRVCRPTACGRLGQVGSPQRQRFSGWVRGARCRVASGKGMHEPGVYLPMLEAPGCFLFCLSVVFLWLRFSCGFVKGCTP